MFTPSSGASPTLGPTSPHRRASAWRIAASVLVTVGLLGAGAAPGHAASRATRAQALTPMTLVLKWVPQAQFAGYYVALKRGYYRTFGIDLKIQPGGPDIVPEQVVESGAADVGLDWLPSLLTQREHGQNLVNIAQIFQTTGMRLVSFKSSGIKSTHDFKSHKIGVWFAGNQYQFLAWMAKLHYNPDHDMTIIHQGFEVNTFLSHQLDMASAMTYNELGVILESGVKLNQLNVFDYGTAGVGMLEDGVYARSDYLRAHRDLVTRFLAASILGWQDTVRNPVAAAKIVFSYDTTGQMKLYHQTYMAREVDKLIMYGPAVQRGIGYMDPAAFARTARISQRYGVITRPPSGAYDQSYWRAATKTLAARGLLMTK